MENRINEQQFDLFGDRTSTASFAANQLRLWFSTFAYLLAARLRASSWPPDIASSERLRLGYGENRETRRFWTRSNSGVRNAG